VHEYLRWAMRIDDPDDCVEFQDMAATLGRTDQVTQLPLDRYVGRDATLDVRSVCDEREFAAAMSRYRATFPPGPLTVPETDFRLALGGGGYHLWTLRRRPDDPEADGIASFFSLPDAGFVGYLALTGPLRRIGALRPLVARIETQLLADRATVRGWYAEVGPDTDITPYRQIGCHELAVDYRQPVPVRLVFKPTGRVYCPPRLTAGDLLTDIASILTSVYGIADPDGHPTLTRLADALPDPTDLVPLR
jgi:hypothetical protein